MKFSNIIISGIVVVVLAATVALLPVRDISSREDFQLLKIEYELDKVKQASSEAESFERLIHTSDASEKEFDIVEKIKREPTKKLSAILEKTIISLLEKKGFAPVTKPQEVQPGLMLTVYDNEEE